MIPWRKERLPTPVFWPGEFHGLCIPWGHKELDTTELPVTTTLNFIIIISLYFSYCLITRVGIPKQFSLVSSFNMEFSSPFPYNLSVENPRACHLQFAAVWILLIAHSGCSSLFPLSSVFPAILQLDPEEWCLISNSLARLEDAEFFH